MKINTIVKIFYICYILRPISSTTFMASCKNDLDCSDLYNSKYFCISEKCQHEPIFPLDQKKLFGLIMIVLVSALANAGGIGGGEIIVPVYIFLFSQTVSDSIPLSKATIFAGAFINFLMIFRYRNPVIKNKLLIDYKISSFIIPLVLAGTMIGVLLTKLLPPIFIFAMLVLYITQATYDIFFKAKKLWNEENLAKNQGNNTKKFEKKNGKHVFDKKNESDLAVMDFDKSGKKIKDCENFSYDLKKNKDLEKGEDLKVDKCDKIEVNKIDVLFKKDLIQENSLSDHYSVLEDNSFSTKSTQEVNSDDSFSITNKIKLKQCGNLEGKKKVTIFSLFKKNLSYIFIAVFTYMILLMISLLRGGKGFHSIIDLNTCSMPSWSLFLVAQIFTIFVSIFIFKRTKNEIQEKYNTEKRKKIEFDIKVEIEKSKKSKSQKSTEAPKSQKSQKNIEIEKNAEKQFSFQKKLNTEELSKLKKLGLLSYITGILAGSLGIGGGIIMNPVLLQLGYQPEIAAAISSFLVLFTSLSTSSQFLIVGAFDFNYAIVIFVFSAIGSFFGNLIIMKMLRKYRRPSLIVWVLFFLLLLSLLVLPPVGFMKILEQKSYFTFGSPC